MLPLFSHSCGYFPHRTPLHAAAFADHVECLQLLLSHSAQVNTADHSGKTPLMMAAQNGHVGAVGKGSLVSAHLEGDVLLQLLCQIGSCCFLLWKLRLNCIRCPQETTFTSVKERILFLLFLSGLGGCLLQQTWVLFPPKSTLSRAWGEQ